MTLVSWHLAFVPLTNWQPLKWSSSEAVNGCTVWTAVSYVNLQGGYCCTAKPCHCYSCYCWIGDTRIRLGAGVFVCVWARKRLCMWNAMWLLMFYRWDYFCVYVHPISYCKCITQYACVSTSTQVKSVSASTLCMFSYWCPQSSVCFLL